MDIKEEKINNNKKEKRVKITNIFYISIIIILTILIILITTVIRPGRVDGTSMFPSLSDSQFISINTIDKNISPGEIVVYNAPTGKKVVKRVIAVGSNTISVVDGVLYINGKATDYPFCYEHENKDPITIKENQFFAMGDNQVVSLDSFGYGGVDKSNLIGKVNTNKNIKINFISK